MKRLAVFFPGIGYHCDKPLLYYSSDLTYEMGYEEQIKLQYQLENDELKKQLRGNLEKMEEVFHALYKQAKEQLAAVAWEQYDEVLFVSKSVGTIVASAYAKEYELQKVKHILYTPLFQTFLFSPKHAVGFIGTNDAWSTLEDLLKIAEANEVPMHVYDGCNHSLEVEDCMKNLEILADVMQETRAELLEI